MNQRSKEIQGYIETFMAYFIWGFLPIYWKQLTALNSLEVIGARIIMSFIVLFIIVTIRKEKYYQEYLKTPKKRRLLLITGILITINWGVFIYAINNNYVVQASFGYYINPIVSIMIGVVILREKLKTLQIIAISIVVVAVIYLGVGIGQLPWISLILAFSFGFYGFFKKKYHMDSKHSLLIELMIALPIMLVYVGATTVKGTSSFLTVSPWEWIFIVLAGIVTIIPLILFANGAKKIPLTSVGILQYIAPSIMLVIGVFMYGEPFTRSYKISFAMIWTAVILYMISLFYRREKKS